MPSELYEKIVSRRGRLESIIARIPGFKGYQEKQARRTADRLIREHIAEELDKRIARLIRAEKRILDDGGLKYMSTTRSAKTKLQTYRDRVQTAAPKYDGMWAQIKIGNDELDRIYAFDEAQLQYLEDIDAAIGGIEDAIKTPEGLTDAIDSFVVVVTEADDAFKLRDDVILDFETE
jgi:hypothetical protein